MEILPTTSGTRPALACEIRPEGVVAARRGTTAGAMAALSRHLLPEGAFRPSLQAGNILDRPTVVTAIRQSLEKVADKTRDIAVIVPDASVRVLLLDFDTLPAKLADALPVVRFRLKKLLPFEADDAAISYQIMSTSRTVVRVVATAMPRDVLAEYESAVREAGFEPGAVLPSTLAALAGLDESDVPSLLINAGPEAVTAAIVRGGILLLHRSVDMRPNLHVEVETRPEPQLPPAIPAELLANPSQDFGDLPQISLPLIDRDDSIEEWAQQEPVPEYPRQEAAPTDLVPQEVVPLPSSEIVQAVSVAAAYFEDTLGAPPSSLLAAGPTSAAQLTAMLAGTPLGAWPIHETIDPSTLPPGQGPAQGPAGGPGAIPRGWLAGIQGALRG